VLSQRRGVSDDVEPEGSLLQIADLMYRNWIAKRLPVDGSAKEVKAIEYFGTGGVSLAGANIQSPTLLFSLTVGRSFLRLRYPPALVAELGCLVW